MNSCDNYPDDIRSYDNDPRSPFYVEPMVECNECNQWCELEEMDENEEGTCFMCVEKQQGKD